MNMFDFTDFPVIDSHAHPFMPTREKTPYARSYCFDNSNKEVDEDSQYLTSYRMVLQEFKRLFNLPNASEQEILDKREALARSDYRAFVKLLYDDCKITAMLSDYGYPVASKYKLTDEELAVFNDATEGIIDVYDIIRIETICERLFKKGMTFEELITSFDDYVAKHIKERKTVGFKSVVGYLTGLRIQEVSFMEASKAFYSFYYTNCKDRAIEKVYRDYMFFHGLELCCKHDLTMQIHTGQGDAPLTVLEDLNPNSLHRMVNTELGKKARIVIVHAGIPYAIEASYLAHTYSNVYVDMSVWSSYCGSLVEMMFPALLDICPHNKLMYGTDVGGLSDQGWFGTVYFKRYFAEELERRVNKNQFTKEYAEKVANMIFYDNCKRIYKLERKYNLEKSSE